jgi:hypothetical protein
VTESPCLALLRVPFVPAFQCRRVGIFVVHPVLYSAVFALCQGVFHLGIVEGQRRTGLVRFFPSQPRLRYPRIHHLTITGGKGFPVVIRELMTARSRGGEPGKSTPPAISLRFRPALKMSGSFACSAGAGAGPTRSHFRIRAWIASTGLKGDHFRRLSWIQFGQCAPSRQHLLRTALPPPNSDWAL